MVRRSYCQYLIEIGGQGQPPCFSSAPDISVQIRTQSRGIERRNDRHQIEEGNGMRNCK